MGVNENNSNAYYVCYTDSIVKCGGRICDGNGACEHVDSTRCCDGNGACEHVDSTRRCDGNGAYEHVVFS